MTINYTFDFSEVGLPSYEGSGLKCLDLQPAAADHRLPSYEGSGLKCDIPIAPELLPSLPSYEGSGLKLVA